MCACSTGKTVLIGHAQRGSWRCISGYGMHPNTRLYCADLNVLIAATWCCRDTNVERRDLSLPKPMRRVSSHVDRQYCATC
jgi:hypothetical protein